MHLSMQLLCGALSVFLGICQCTSKDIYQNFTRHNIKVVFKLLQFIFLIKQCAVVEKVDGIDQKKLRVILFAFCFKKRESKPILLIQWILLTFRCNVGCSIRNSLSMVYKKDVICTWILHSWIMNRWIVYREIEATRANENLDAGVLGKEYWVWCNYPEQLLKTV